jgi:hypothetical protein
VNGVGDEAYVLSLFGAKFRVLYYKQFLNKRCGVGKNCWLIDDYIWEEVWVTCALLDS